MTVDTVDQLELRGQPSDRRLRVLLSAYACSPELGSEPGIGWNTARGLALFHEVWLLTHADFREPIERELSQRPIPNLHIVYHELPDWTRFWLRGSIGEQASYYLWQLSARPIASRICATAAIDIAHHVTFGKFWAPTCFAELSVPCIVGPMGGGEAAPLSFWFGFGPYGMLYEIARSLARWIGERDPFVRSEIRRASIVLATSDETLDRLKRLGAPRASVLCPLAFADVGSAGDLALSDWSARSPLPPNLPSELAYLMSFPAAPATPTRFISIGRLIHWKGIHLGLRAFAQAQMRGAEFWLVGDGPDRKRLERLADQLGIADQVVFLGGQTRNKTFEILSECHALVVPSLHDSSGWVFLEAMAMGRPVICLNTGGPGHIVSEQAGIKCRVSTPKAAISDLAVAMRSLNESAELRREMGLKGQQRVIDEFSLRRRSEEYSQLYREFV